MKESNKHLFYSVPRALVVTFFVVISLFTLTSCEKHESVITGVQEREANEIIVFLASKGIAAHKAIEKAGGAGGSSEKTYSISVDERKTTLAMSILNQNGLPRKKGTDLLELFKKEGLMSSEKEETIRYQAGLAESIATTIGLIDGVIDAKVQIAFPERTETEEEVKQKTTASVYVKHQGILDDPNSHLITKIKRIVSSSVNNLDINDVTVVSDRSRFTDITLNGSAQPVSGKPKEYISIWSIVMSSDSAGKFRFLFTFFTMLTLVLAAGFGWLMWKIYPVLRKKGFKELLSPAPLNSSAGDTAPQHEESEEENPPIE